MKVNIIKTRGTKQVIFSLFLIMVLMVAGCNANDDSKEYPNKDVEILAQMGVGGTMDLSSHALSKAFEEETGQTLVVNTQSGGAGVPGTKKLVDAAADGYTISMISSGLLNVRPLVQDVPYNFPEDFTPIIGVGDFRMIPVANIDQPYDTVAEMVEYYEENGGEPKIGTPGVNTHSHLFAELLEDETGMKYRHVPFDSSKKVASQLLGDHVDVGVINVSDVYEDVQAGKLKILGVPTEERYEDLPDISTIQEQGIDIVGGPTFGIWGPADMPQEMVDTLNETFSKAMDSDDFVKLAESTNILVTKTPPEEMEEAILRDMENIEKVLEK